MKEMLHELQNGAPQEFREPLTGNREDGGARLCLTCVLLRTLGTDIRFAAVRSLRKHLGDTNMQANGEKDRCNFELSRRRSRSKKLRRCCTMPTEKLVVNDSQLGCH